MRSIRHAARGSCLFAVTLLASSTLVSPALTAEGDPCTADADCGEGYACEDGDSAGAPGEGGAAPEPPGTCVIARRPCTSDADCDANYECEIYDAPSTVVCDEEGSCEVLPPEESTIGECVGVPLECATDADCPEPSSCMSGLCTFAFAPCTADTDCDDLYLCLADESEVCTSYDCSSDDPDCVPETVCEPVEDAGGHCFPAPQPCSTDADCTGEWTCYDVPNDNELPGAWKGVDKSCLPPGIVGAVEGWVALEGEEYDDSDTAGSVQEDPELTSEAGAGPVAEGEDAAPRGEGGASGEADDADAAEVEATASAAAETDDGGCRAAGAGATGTSALARLLAAAGRAGGRRRRRSSR